MLDPLSADPIRPIPLPDIIAEQTGAHHGFDASRVFSHVESPDCGATGYSSMTGALMG